MSWESRCSFTTMAALCTRKGAAVGAGRDIHDGAPGGRGPWAFPTYVLDYETVFRESVIDDSRDSYLAGATARCPASAATNG